MSRGRKAAHVGANLGEQHAGRRRLRRSFADGGGFDYAELCFSAI
jgi:hypothetical protein